MHLRKISLALLLALLIPACADKPPIPEEKFVEFYIRLQLIDTQYGANAALQKEKVDSLMTAFEISKDEFDSTMSWYGRKPERWERFFSEVNRKLAGMKPDFVKQKRR